MYTKSQINILNNTILMHQISTKAAPSAFLSKLKKPSHLYSTRFCNVNYIKPTYKLNKCKFQISVRGPYLWNEFLTQTEKEIENTSSFKILVKQRLLSSYNELSHFWKSWKLVLINEKLPFLICDFYMIWCMGFDDKTSMVLCESHPCSEYYTNYCNLL